jgi:hypothetical protein
MRKSLAPQKPNEKQAGVARKYWWSPPYFSAQSPSDLELLSSSQRFLKGETRMQFKVIGLVTCGLLFPLALLGQSPSETLPAENSQAPVQQATAQNQQSGGNNGSAGNSAGSSAPAAVVTGYTFPTDRQMMRFGFRGVAGFRALVGSAFSAGWHTWVQESTEEWGQGGSGWAKRFGARVMDNGINQSTLVMLSMATHRDPLYYRCDCTGLWPRAFHAFKMTVVGRDRTGAGRLSIAEVVSPFVGPLITRNTIYPDRYDSGDGAVAGAYFMLGTAGWNLVREFFLKGPKW